MSLAERIDERFGIRPAKPKPRVEPCYCGEPCHVEWRAKPDEPCWGKVHAIEEIEGYEGDYWFVHGCDGHAEFDRDWKIIYTPESKDEQG